MSTIRIGAFAAKTHFSELLEKARAGATIIVTKRGKPIAQIGPSEEESSSPVFGSERGRIRFAADFEAPVADMADYER
jgi:prevent-host-death family protein